MKFLEARNQHRDTGIPLQMYGERALFRIHSTNSFSSRRVNKINWLKFLSTIAHIFLQIVPNFVEMQGLDSATCAPNFVEVGAQEHSFHTLLLFGAKKKKKNTKKIQLSRVSGTCISGSAGAISFKFGM